MTLETTVEQEIAPEKEKGKLQAYLEAKGFAVEPRKRVDDTSVIERFEVKGPINIQEIFEQTAYRTRPDTYRQGTLDNGSTYAVETTISGRQLSALQTRDGFVVSVK